MSNRLWWLAIIVSMSAVASSSATLAQEPAPGGKPDLYVLAVQINTKTLERGETPNSREADLLQSLADERATQYYGRVHSRVIVRKEADRDHILAGLEWLRANVRDRDVAIVFIAGHGSYNEQRGVYRYHPIGRPILDTELRQALDGVRGRNILLLQTCHAAALLKKDGAIQPLSRTLAICACDEDEEATRLMGMVMINGLAGLAADERGVVTSDSLANFIAQRVPKVSAGKQTVQVCRPESFTDFPLVAAGAPVGR